MKFCFGNLAFCVCLLCAANCFSLDREAFSIPNYNLIVRIEPEQHRMGVRGLITLRNDSEAAQKTAVLQISSSLAWRSIRAGDKDLQYLTQSYTSDIDHTGGLSEAIVTLSQSVAPHGTIELSVGYEGVIVSDATRLARIGVPEDQALAADWDIIGDNFSAVRGVGYVAWYPIATDAANMSEEGNLSEVLGRWKARQAQSRMDLLFESTKKSKILFSGTPNDFVAGAADGILKLGAFSMIRPGMNIPTFILADFEQTETKSGSTIYFSTGKQAIAAAYTETLEKINLFPNTQARASLQIVELPYTGAAPFVSENILLTPFRAPTEEDKLTLVYTVARQKATSPRPWINDGLAHLAQILDVEQKRGRKSTLDYLTAHMSLLIELEKQFSAAETGSQSFTNSAASHSLVNSSDEIYIGTKSMWIWSMLRDMVGDLQLNLALSGYNAALDKEPSYMQKLLEKASQRDLEWFFDDWVYRDRGLPDFKVESAFARKTLNNSYMLTVTVANLGTAGAEVPVIIKFAGGEMMKRLEVRAKDKATTRIEMTGMPQEIRVNDGSVPEVDLANNTFKVPATQD